MASALGLELLIFGVGTALRALIAQLCPLRRVIPSSSISAL